MKKLLLISFIIFNLSMTNSFSQSWKEMMDSAKFYQDSSKYDIALKWAKLALPQAEKEFGKNDTNYASALCSIAKIFFFNGQLDTAVFYQEKQLTLSRALFKGDHPDLAENLYNMAYFYNKRGRLKEAESLFVESLGMFRRIYAGKDNSNFATDLINLARFYNNQGRFKEAEPLFVESLEIFRRIYAGKDYPDLALCIGNMAAFYYRQGRFKEAEPLFIEALEMNRRMYAGKDNPDLSSCMNNIAGFYEVQGRFKEAEQLYNEALEMDRRLFAGKDNYQLANCINNMALYYQNQGRNKEVEPLYTEALAMYRRIYAGKDSPELANSINNMAYFYDKQGRFNEAESLYTEALAMYRRIFAGKDHPELANIINNMAVFYIEQRRNKEAEPLSIEALEMFRRIFAGKDHPSLVKSIINMARFYEDQGRFKEAEPLFIEALEMNRRIYASKDHPLLAISINIMAGFYEEHGRFKEAEPLFIEGIKIYTNVLNNYFPSLSEKEKKQFWNTMSHSFEQFNTFSSYRAKENPSILCNMYDVQLYTKGLLFNSQNRIKSRIINSGDSSLISLYRRWTDMKEFLIPLYKMTDAQLKKKGLSIDSLEKVANGLEKKISLKSEGFSQSYEKKKVTWKSIQTLLKPDEAAVEAIRFRLYKDGRFTDTICYAFLIITDQTEEHPDLVLFEDGSKLEKEYYNEYRNLVKIKAKDTISSNRYWGPLYDKLKNYKKIYFSADGIYNKLNPSTFMLPNGKYLLDIQDIQQVNSTKDLLLGYYKTKDESNIYNSAVLIGNPNFALAEEKVVQANRQIKGEKQEEKSSEQLASIRGIELIRLPGTEKEINDIGKFLKNKNWVVNSYLGDMAVKEAVKSSNSPRILHIATHGLFLEDVKRGEKDLFGFDEQKMIDNPLLRSGLFFTGADNFLKSDEQKNVYDENGLMTAYEAMNLNLDKTELVVLSACETGLGEIQNGEGVFGLRRAFQQAGAKAVLMSLWKVNDDATQELMSKFYENWVSGKTKREAFALAQQQIRAKYPDPYYWGAFVMVGE